MMTSIIKPGRPGEVREVYFVHVLAEERSTELLGIVDTKEEALEIVNDKRNYGWWGSIPTFESREIICSEDGEWSNFRVIEKLNIEKVKERARSRLTPYQRKVLGIE